MRRLLVLVLFLTPGCLEVTDKFGRTCIASKATYVGDDACRRECVKAAAANKYPDAGLAFCLDQMCRDGLVCR